MLKIKVNNKFEFELHQHKDAVSINGQSAGMDVLQIKNDTFHLLYKNKSYKAELIHFNEADKTCKIKVNSKTYTLDIKDQFDELLHSLGMDNLNTVKVAELKSPMPGLVLKVFVNEGDTVKKGDSILVLEAMKMENIIKAPADGRVKSIRIKPSDKLEKNQVMILFE